MDGPSKTIQHPPHRAQASNGLWEKRPAKFKPYYETLLPEDLGTHCCAWPAGKPSAEVQMLVKTNSKPHDIVIYMDRSVTRDLVWLGVHCQAGLKDCTRRQWSPQTSSPDHGSRSSHTCNTWLASQHDAQITHAILTASMNLLQKVESGMGCPDWHTAIRSLWLQRLLWIYSPGHAGISGNERADRLASTADVTSDLQLGRAEVLRGLRNFLNMGRPEHHSTDCLKERGVEKGSGRHSTLQGRERSLFNQANIGTVSRASLRILLRDRAERVWAFLSTMMPS